MYASKGEIWNVENTNGGAGKDVLIIAKRDQYAIVLCLVDRYIANGVSVMTADGIRYTDPGRIGYVFESAMINMQEKVSEKKMDEIMREVSATLGISLADQDTDGQQAKDSEDNRSVDFEIARREAEIYKGLYRELLDKLTGRS